MAYKQQNERYRRWYAKLLRFYPLPFRERFGASMEQTFNDLCREREEAGNSLFGFVLWTFVDTLLGAFKEGISHNMKSSAFKVVLATSVINIIALAILFVVWWVNGRDDTWLFLTLALIVLTSFLAIKNPSKE